LKHRLNREPSHDLVDCGFVAKLESRGTARNNASRLALELVS
jgi:hypothetical protein